MTTQLQNKFNLPEDVLSDLILVLRCADADLQGVGQRYDEVVYPTSSDVDAAEQSRRGLSRIHRIFTGQKLIP